MSSSLAYHLFYSPPKKIEELLRHRNLKQKPSSKSSGLQDNLAFAYNNLVMDTEVAVWGESYGYIKNDYSEFDYLKKENESLFNYLEVEYINEELESDEEFSKRWEESVERCSSPMSVSSESDSDGDWFNV